MWHSSFASRLTAWNSLRQQVESLPLENALSCINLWWFGCPWNAYYLHWDDKATWPNPWQLLSDNIYCDLARGLGILYTVALLERRDMADAELIQTEQTHNLIQVVGSRYILNWEPDQVVRNISYKITRSLPLNTIQALYK